MLTTTARRFCGPGEDLSEEIRDLAADGCTYLQLDDTALPCNCDAHARRMS